jgi:hypothetical protein
VAAAQKEAAKASLRRAVDTAVEKADQAAAAGQSFLVIHSETTVDVLALREAATTIINKHKVGTPKHLWPARAFQKLYSGLVLAAALNLGSSLVLAGFHVLLLSWVVSCKTPAPLFARLE